VAQLAGLPKPVIERARELLQLFENSAPQRSRTGPGRISHEPAAQPVPQPVPQPDPGMASVASALKQIDVNHISPIEALTKLYELKQMLSS
jgi:DNA mismatch repair protein MutS